MTGDNEEDIADALRDELSTLRKALDLSERRRVQMQQRTVRLAEQLVGLQGRLSELSEQATAEHHRPQAPAPSLAFRAFQGGAGDPTPVDLTEANAVLRSAMLQAAKDTQGEARQAPAAAGESPDDDLAEEFLLVSADSYLDRAKLARLEQQVARQEAADRARRTVQVARRNVFMEEQSMETAAPAPGARSVSPRPVTGAPTRPSPWRQALQRNLTLGKVGNVLLAVALMLALSGMVIWFFGIDILP